MIVAVERVDAPACYPLRRAVLRDGDAGADVDWPEDSLPGAFHLAWREHGETLAVASFAPVAAPHRPRRDSWQLRGMAVEPGQQGRGLGRALLDDGVARLRALGAAEVWANARDTALGFYVRYGMRVVGEGFVVESLGLPHHVIVLELT